MHILDTLPRTFGYDGDGNLTTITVTEGANTWTRTFTWTDGKLTADSGWVRS